MAFIDIAWNVPISLMVLALGVSLVLRWLRASGLMLRHTPPLRLSEQQAGRGEGSYRESAVVFGCALLFRILVFAAASLLALRLMGGGQTIASLWTKWDALHYMQLVENGYAGYTENGRNLFLVFYPLYVWLVRGVRLAIGDTLLSGLLVSFLCYAGGCVYLYRLAFQEYGRAVAWRAVLFLSVFPFAFFFGGMMTEGLFLLTTAAGLYHIRRHEWLFAGLWGILAAMTRMHGLLLVGAAFAELIQAARPFAPADGRRFGGLRAILRPLPAILLPFLGTAAYLGLNFAVEGDLFAFVRHQDHWNQGFQWISQVLGYVVQNALGAGELVNRLTIWIPELLLFVLFFALLWHERGRHRSMLTLYAYASLILDYSLSWLLSAGRYLSCAIPFFLFAACLTRRRPCLTAVLTGVMGVLFMTAAICYLMGKPIM